MPGLTDGVQGSQSLSWLVIIRFYLRDYCRLISNCFLSLSLALFLSSPSNYPGLIVNSKKAQVIFLVVDSVCWEHKRTWTSCWLNRASFRFCTLVTWSVLGNSSSSKTLQRRAREKNRWTLHSSMVQKRNSLYLQQSTKQPKNTHFLLSWTANPRST